MSKPLLIAMVGLPRSGKSTLSQALAEDFVRAIAKVMIRSLFLSGSSIVIADETHFSRASRDHVKDKAWDTMFYLVPTHPDVCKERAIATDQPDLISIIDGMMARWDAIDTKERVNIYKVADVDKGFQMD